MSADVGTPIPPATRRNPDSRHDALASFRHVMDSLPPAARFDRFAVCDMRPFVAVPRRDDTVERLETLRLRVDFGFPVVIDPGVEVGVVELRKGDEVVDRILFSELRA